MKKKYRICVHVKNSGDKFYNAQVKRWWGWKYLGKNGYAHTQYRFLSHVEAAAIIDNDYKELVNNKFNINIIKP